MKITCTKIPDVFVVEPTVFGDDRGLFFESFNSRVFSEAIGRKVGFVQDNQSRSVKAVLRGLHYQVGRPQGKLVRVTHGDVFDVAVDLRRQSETFGQWIGERLTSENKRQLWIPEGFAHGFLVMSDYAEFQYKTTDFWFPEHERCIRYDDPRIDIHWPVIGQEFPVALGPVLSDKDKNGQPFDTAEMF